MDELLNEIMQAALCSFLSDLQSTEAVFDERTKEQIMQIPNSRYTLVQWCAAATYVTGKPCHAESVQRAKESICQISN